MEPDRFPNVSRACRLVGLEPKPRFTLPEASRLLGLGRSTLDRWCRERRIPHERFGTRTRIPIEDLEAFLAEARREAVS